MHKTISFVALLALLTLSFEFAAKAQQVERLEPSSWWIGFQNPRVQVLVYGQDIATLQASVDHPGVVLEKTIAVENPNYLFLDLLIDETAQPGEVKIDFKQGKRVRTSALFELLEREAGSASRVGFNQSDAIYLIMPDRFANGKTENDEIPGMLEKLNREDPYGRHGGDLEGIRQRLDFIADMGFTAIWINPVLENDQPQSSYHGYAITDYYRVDQRLGSNEEYRQLVQEARSKGIKIIKDMVFNHCGHKHWWMDDLPMGDERDAFTSEGRSATENELLDYLSAVLNYRKTSEVLQQGHTLHFLPENQVYVYFRYLGEEAVMVLMNNSDNENAELDTARFNEILKDYKSGREVVSGQTFESLNKIKIPAKSAFIIELKP